MYISKSAIGICRYLFKKGTAGRAYDFMCSDAQSVSIIGDFNGCDPFTLELPANELAGFLVDRPTGLSLPKLPPQSLRFFFYLIEEIVLLSEYLY